MPKPVKAEYSERIGSVAQVHFEFLVRKLWGAGGDALRQQFISTASQEGLKALLQEHKIEFPAGAQIMVVDLQNAKTNGLNAAPTADYYILVLPPKPTRHGNEPHYLEMQGWSAAYYHAINDSYGM